MLFGIWRNYVFYIDLVSYFIFFFASRSIHGRRNLNLSSKKQKIYIWKDKKDEIKEIKIKESFQNIHLTLKRTFHRQSERKINSQKQFCIQFFSCRYHENFLIRLYDTNLCLSVFLFLFSIWLLLFCLLFPSYHVAVTEVKQFAKGSNRNRVDNFL